MLNSVCLLGLTAAVQWLACAPSPRLAGQEPTCIAGQVIDGDTFRCQDGRKVRLIGVDSPERELWVGPTLVNEAMVRGGWAVLYTVPPNVKYAGRLRRAQNEARAGGAGLWAQNGFACLPSDFRRGACVNPP